MKIAFLVIPNVLATSMSNAYELFFAGNQIARMRNRSKTPHVSLHKVAVKIGRVDLPSGLSLFADTAINDDIYDLVYVPALWRNPKPIVNNNPKIVNWLRRQYEHGAIINGTGTGVRFIAETGLLNNRPATTHWHHFDDFARDYPEVKLKRQHFITNAGRLYCAASINAQTDLTLHHIHRIYGKETSDHLAQHFSHEVRQDFDKLNFNQDKNSNHPDEKILQTQLWMQNNLAKTDIQMSELANSEGMSQRNFTRRFRIATDMTPVEYLQSKRIELARDLLQNSNLSISEIAYRVGYLDVSYFTQLFKQKTSITPKAYRTQVRAKLFSDKPQNN